MAQLIYSGLHNQSWAVIQQKYSLFGDHVVLTRVRETLGPLQLPSNKVDDYVGGYFWNGICPRLCFGKEQALTDLIQNCFYRKKGQLPQETLHKKYCGLWTLI